MIFNYFHNLYILSRQLSSPYMIFMNFMEIFYLTMAHNLRAWKGIWTWQQANQITRGFIQALKVVILPWYFHKSKTTSKCTNVQMININYNLHWSVKIKEWGGQVIVTRKDASFGQVWHPYMPINATWDKMLWIKVVNLLFVSS